MNVKVQGLINGAAWIEATYGREALGKVLKACGPALRDRYVSAIAINWHPLEEFLEFVQVADRLLGKGNGDLAQELGAAGARANMKSVMLRFVFYISKPDFLMRRIAGMWSQFNDQGTMELVHIESNRLVIRVSGIDEFSPLFIRVLTGWANVVVSAIASDTAVARVVDCVEKGDGARCDWELSWTGAAGRRGPGTLEP